ncbi:MAG: sugar ABC transporter substrate-binding protein, partial [Nocardioidaceae bacterium]
EEGTVMVINVNPGISTTDQRQQGFEEQIATYPDIEVVATQAADFDRSEALTVMTDVLQANPDIDGVYAANDEMAMGVLSALKARGLQGDVALVGNDGIRDAFTAISEGDMYATNAESPYALGQAIVDAAADVIEGKDVEDDVVLQGELITAKEVPAYCAHLVDIGDTETCPNLAE